MKFKILHIIFFIVGALIVLNAFFVLSFIQGMDFGVMVMFVVAFLFFVFTFKPLWYPPIEKKIHPIIKKVVYWVFITGLTVVLILQGLIIVGGVFTKTPEKTPEYVIVLGAAIRHDGMPTLALRYRLDKCVEYVLDKPDVKIVVSGGQGPNEPFPEADGMADYLIRKGIDDTRIIRERKSTSTMENFKFSKELISSDEVTVITNDFHILRSTIIAKRNGIKAYGYSARTPNVIILNSYFRELFALVKSLFMDF